VPIAGPGSILARASTLRRIDCFERQFAKAIDPLMWYHSMVDDDRGECDPGEGGRLSTVSSNAIRVSAQSSDPDLRLFPLMISRHTASTNERVIGTGR
jgi:hypothetical protein